ncbi:MAG TPA: sulfatase [Candidatus Binatia bacterium]|jgi:arylsulfatase A-like enzyme
MARRLVFLFVALAAGAAAAFLLRPAGRPADHSYPGDNVLLISVDTLRADRLSNYGYSRATSPSIDALARRAITFERAYAPRGMTWPSLATMLTSLAPSTTNLRWNGQYLDPEVATVIGLAHDGGYRTAAFTGGSVCNLARSREEFDERQCGDDVAITRAAIEFFRANATGRFFAWVHLMAPHAPYNPPAAHDLFTRKDYAGPVSRERVFLDGIVLRQADLSPDDLAEVNGLYDGEVHFADAQVGALMAALEQEGLAARTVVVFVADHGEDLWQHNRYLYHECSIYESVLRIPMIVALPDGAGAGTRVSRIVAMADVTPTLAKLVGLPLLSSFEGKSLLQQPGGGDARAADGGDAIASSEWYSADSHESMQTVRTSRWRYISNPDGITPKCAPEGDYYKVAREELYDHSVDPDEKHNVVAEHPELAKALSTLTAATRAASPDSAPAVIDEKLKGELRSFGYLQ